MGQRLKAEVRRAIVEAARVLFARDGYAGASLRSIAVAAERSLGNLRNYFASKDELFEAVVGETVAEVQRAIEGWQPPAPPSDWNELTRVDARAVRAVAAYIIEHRRPLSLLLDGSAGSALEGWADRIFEAYATLELRHLAHVLEQRPGRVARRPSRRLVRALCRMYFELAKDFVRGEISEVTFRATLHEYDDFRLAGLRGFVEEQRG